MFGIGIGGQFDVERDRTALSRLRPGAARCIHAIGKDSGAAPPGIKPFQGGAQVAERGKRVGMSTDAARKGRVDEHDARHQLRIEHVVDQFAVMRAQCALGKGMMQQTRAPGIDLIEEKASAGKMTVYGQEPGPGRGLEHDIACRDRGCPGGKEADRCRCRELLERDLRFATHAVRGKRRRHGDQLGKPHIRICWERRVLQMENLREFEHIVGVAQ